MTTDLPQASDVRMRGFARRTTVVDALAWVDAQSHRLPAEQVEIWQAAGRVLASDLSSGVNVPSFDRSMMDGFAVQAADTEGATVYNRLELTVAGQSLPGAPFSGQVGRGQAVRIMTGAPLPRGADAVLPAERAEVDASKVVVLEALPPGKNIGRCGEDVAAGATVLLAGRVLRPQDLGLISSIGQTKVEVVRRPHVRIVVTGNELLPAGSAEREAARGKIADSNGPMLAALIERDGGMPVRGEAYPVPDDPAAILAAMRLDADMVLVSGGSSVGQEDHAPALLAGHGDLAIPGIAMRPSSPAGMGKRAGKLVFLLPGNPVSCLCAYDFFAGRAIRLLGGRKPDWPYGKVRFPLARKLVSQVGRVDYARVRIVANRVEPIAISGASILSSTTAADGFVVVPADSEGFAAGAEVEVHLYDDSS